MSIFARIPNPALIERELARQQLRAEAMVAAETYVVAAADEFGFGSPEHRGAELEVAMMRRQVRRPGR